MLYNQPMSDFPLFKYAAISDTLTKALITPKTNDEGNAYTIYKNDKTAVAAYNDSEIKNRIKRWILSENLAVLTGAGASITTTDEGKSLDEDPIKYTGKSVWHIWQKCKEILPKETIDPLLVELDEPDAEENSTFQLERFLSKLEIFIAANSKSQNDDLKTSVANCKTVKDGIIKVLKEECELTLHKTAPHTKFLRDIMAARSDRSRLQLFTLNYDTLFEQAAEAYTATVIDGFAFARNPVFNGANFDLDIVKREKNRIQHNENYEEKVFQLYKLHGSLDWRKDTTTERIIRVQDIKAGGETIFIPPSVHKFEQSYDMPYFEMMSRFQQSLRRENTTLVIIGYSFSDNHINRAIVEALHSNLNFELVIISPTATKDSSNETLKDLQGLIDRGQNNITLVSDTFQRFTSQIPSFAKLEKEVDELYDAGAFNITPKQTGLEPTDEIPF